MQGQLQVGPNAAMNRIWDAIHGSRGDRDFAICQEYDDVESGIDLANPTTNQLVETVSHDSVNVTPVINGEKPDMEAVHIQAVAATPVRVPHVRSLPPETPTSFAERLRHLCGHAPLT